MKYLSIKNFERFQHYHDRIPPWIKLYNALLDDYAFLQLGDAARAHLILLWLVASRHKNRIPFDAKYIASAIHATSRVDIQALIDGGFVTVTDDATAAQDASKIASTPLAICTDSGDLEGEGEERRGEESAAWVSVVRQRWLLRVGRSTPTVLVRELGASVRLHGVDAILRAIDSYVDARASEAKPAKLAWFADEVALWVQRSAPIVDPATGLLTERGMAVAGGAR